MTEFLTWQIGAVRVTRIQESEAIGLDEFLKDAVPENLKKIGWLKPHFVNEDGEPTWSIHALVLEVGDRRLLVDTCVGNDKNLPVPHWNQLQGSFLQDLEAAGFPPESIDTVLCTHLHVDHVGWNTTLENGVWKPTFKNARYLVAREEWAHWQTENDGFTESVFSESIRPVEEAGLIDLINWQAQICPEIRLERHGIP